MEQTLTQYKFKQEAVFTAQDIEGNAVSIEKMRRYLRYVTDGNEAWAEDIAMFFIGSTEIYQKSDEPNIFQDRSGREYARIASGA